MSRFYRKFGGLSVGFDRRRKDNVWELGIATKAFDGRAGPWVYKSTGTVRKDAALKRAPKLIAELLLQEGVRHVEWGQQLMDRGAGLAEQAEQIAKLTGPDANQDDD
jgi:hypothetical protein